MSAARGWCAVGPAVGHGVEGPVVGDKSRRSARGRHADRSATGAARSSGDGGWGNAIGSREAGLASGLVGGQAG